MRWSFNVFCVLKGKGVLGCLCSVVWETMEMVLWARIHHPILFILEAFLEVEKESFHCWSWHLISSDFSQDALWEKPREGKHVPCFLQGLRGEILKVNQGEPECLLRTRTRTKVRHNPPCLCFVYIELKIQEPWWRHDNHVRWSIPISRCGRGFRTQLPIQILVLPSTRQHCLANPSGFLAQG